MRRWWLSVCLMCVMIWAVPAAAAPTPDRSVPVRQDNLTEEQIATLNSLQQINDHPLYTMQYYADYPDPISGLTAASGGNAAAYAPVAPADLTDLAGSAENAPAWACSLFAALGDANTRLFGRNFDWQHSPALLLYTDPAEGYASVALVDLEYFGFADSNADGIAALPLEDRVALLDTPLTPFDGMNERGVAIGMAAVNPSPLPRRADHAVLGSIEIIRAVLDHAANVDEALALFDQFDLEIEGGVPLHYLIADAGGQAALVEFYQGEMIVTRSKKPWHAATNFICAAVKQPAGQCERYDIITAKLDETGGTLTAADAMQLLSAVAQPGSTQWSIVYGLTTGDIQIAMHHTYDQIEHFSLDLTAE